MDALNGGTTGAGDDGVTGSTSDRFDQSAIKPAGGSAQGGGMRKRNAAAEPEHADAGISTTQKVTRLLAAVDVFPKAEEDIVDQTASGAVVSIVALAIIALLFLSEFARYLSVHTREHLEVDVTTGTTLPIHFNITFHALRCSQCRMDVMDVSGDQQVNVIQNIHKQRISSSGSAIGRPVLDNPGLVVVDEGAGEGCVLWGTLLVNRVAGNVHVALGASHHRSTTQHVHQFMIAELNSFNASHTITHFSFGEVPASAPASYRDRPHPLNGVTRVAPKADAKMAHFQYFLKIVPTRYVSGHAHDAGAGLAGVVAGAGKGGRAGTSASPRARNGADRASANSFQYSVTEHTHLLAPATSNADMDTHKIPGVFFIYDLSAFMIRVESYSVPFSSFFTSVCAIVGGVLTVAGIVDALLFHGSRTLAKSATANAVTGTVLAKLTAAKAGPTTRTV